MQKCINDNSSFFLLGSPNSGKSSTIKSIVQILLQNKKIDNFIVFSPTEQMTHFYETIIPNKNIFCNFNSEIIEKLNKLLDIIIKLEKKKKKLCLIFDDCFHNSDPKATKRIMTEIIMNHRHYNITYFISLYNPYERIGSSINYKQNYDNLLMPYLRVCYEYILLFHNHNIRKLYNIFNIQYSFEEFEKKYKCAIENNGYYYCVNIFA